jgi:hypothetical protein
MVAIQNDKINFDSGKFTAKCECGKVNIYANKANALRMLNNGSCRYCKKDYRAITENIPIFKTSDGKWSCRCSGCDSLQSYTRKDHAKQSYLRDWQCKKCINISKKFSQNSHIGDKKRIYNRFYKSALNRGIHWSLTIEDMFSSFDGYCALTGWELSLKYENTTASLDRIDCKKGYLVSNIQWVHTIVNMSKNKYSQDEFITMCKAVAKKW